MDGRKRRFSMVFVYAWLFALCVVAGRVAAEEAPWINTDREGLYRFPLAPANTSSPRMTMDSFISNMDQAYSYIMEAKQKEERSDTIFFHTNEVKQLIRLAERHFAKAVQCLNLSRVPQLYRKDSAYESALLLKEILDRINVPAFAQIPGQEVARGNEGRSWRIPGTEIQIAEEEEGRDKGKYLFTPETVKKLELFYKKVEYLPYRRDASEGFYDLYSNSPGTLYPPRWAKFFPEWSKRIVADQTLWQWAGMFLILALSLAFFLFVVKTCSRKWSEDASVFRLLMEFVPPVTAVVISLAASMIVDDLINITGPLLKLSLGGLNIVRWLGLAWATFMTGDLLSRAVVSLRGGDRLGVDVSLVRTLNRLISLSLAVAVLLRGANSMGLSLIPVITGFGVVGLAFSLAAKPTVENIIGGITLFADRTVRVGEYCQFGDTIGKVMHIGLRSTRIRSRDRTIVSIPNADFSQLEMTNLSRRDYIPFRTKLGLRYETTAEQLRDVQGDVRAFLESHPEVDSERHAPQVFFSAFGAYSLDVSIKAYVKTGSWSEFKPIREELLFGIMDILEARGVSLAFPSRTTYLEQAEQPIPVKE